jgi:hypothetical protein
MYLFLKSGDKNNPSKYMAILINPILDKLYGIILENKISIWLESHEKGRKAMPDL